MERIKAPIVALTLLALVASPANVMAGPFGLFKRCKRKATCCPPTTCAPAQTTAQSEGVISIHEVDAPVYYCQAYFKPDPGQVNCDVPPSPLCGDEDGTQPCDEDCEKGRDAAIAWIQARIPDGCTGTISTQCFPSCEPTVVPVAAQSGSSCCIYQVTYKIYCCGGQVIDLPPSTDVDLDFAKFKAKSFACAYAKATGCRPKCCCWIVRRVPG